ncbi:hypothetical protein Vau01_016370 [Virgisporangium aurantiacum]|uniref:Uncharacterized protein n=1 Tax=Virgisporangium aurantiacum TaxID=175570 RepID=A0A8J3YYL2_9ACTN|nr:hypothetical protein Vau01_016370 [Virgisporangium aurantiacum]
MCSRHPGEGWPDRGLPLLSDLSIGGALPPVTLSGARFAFEIGRRLGQPDYRPKTVADPIAHIMPGAVTP